MRIQSSLRSNSFSSKIQSSLRSNSFSSKIKKIVSLFSLFIFSILITTTHAPVIAVPEPPPSLPPKKLKVINGLPYTRKLRVSTTSYDGNCRGCRGRTRSGTEVKRGVCAVDPDVIPLGTWFYIPNYGGCHAEDTGGAVKGYHVDVGWEDVKKGWLPQGEKYIYLPK